MIIIISLLHNIPQILYSILSGVVPSLQHIYTLHVVNQLMYTRHSIKIHNKYQDIRSHLEKTFLFLSDPMKKSVVNYFCSREEVNYSITQPSDICSKIKANDSVIRVVSRHQNLKPIIRSNTTYALNSNHNVRVRIMQISS